MRPEMKTAEVEVIGTEVRVYLTCSTEEDARAIARTVMGQMKLAGVAATGPDPEEREPNP